MRRQRAMLVLAIATCVILLPLLIAAAILAYMVAMPGSSFRGSLPALSSEERDSAERLAADVEVLARQIGERNYRRYDALQDAATIIEKRIEELGLQSVRRHVDLDDRAFFSIETVLPGSASQCLVVGAHYDSVVGSPGADDNGSGVAIGLEMLRQLRGESFRHPVRVVFFVNEEPPHYRTPVMGSLEYARQLVDEDIDVAAMLALESLGYYSDAPGSQQYPAPLLGALYPDTADFVAFVGNLPSRSLVRRSLKGFRASVEFPSEGIAAPDLIPGIGWSDHWSFWQQGFPAVMVTGTAPFRNVNYHESTDTVETVDPERMARVTRGLVGVMRYLDR